MSQERERSPRHEQPDPAPNVPFADKFQEVECGGGGDCGYLCLAAGLGFDKGEKFSDMESELPARALTIHHDIFKHLTMVTTKRILTLPHFRALRRRKQEPFLPIGSSGRNPR